MANLKDVFFNSLFRVPFMALNICGFDFKKTSSDDGRLTPADRAKLFYFKVAFLNVVLFNLLRVADLANHYDQLHSTIETVVGTVNTFAVVWKIQAIYSFRRKIREMFEGLNDANFINLDQKTQLAVTGSLKVYRTLLHIQIGLVGFSDACQFILPLIVMLYTGKRTLPLEFWLPFDPFLTSVRYHLVHLWCNWNMVLIGTYYFASDMVILGIISMIIVRFKILKEEIKVCVFESRGLSNFLALVKRHQELVDLITQFNEIFASIFLLNVVACLLLCFYAFLATSTNDFAGAARFAALFQTLMFELFQFCYLSQKLSDSMTDIADEIYATNWYQSRDKELKGGILLMMLQAQKQSYVMAGDFAALNLAAFSRVRTFCDPIIRQFNFVSSDFEFNLFAVHVAAVASCIKIVFARNYCAE